MRRSRCGTAMAAVMLAAVCGGRDAAAQAPFGTTVAVSGQEMIVGWPGMNVFRQVPGPGGRLVGYWAEGGGAAFYELQSGQWVRTQNWIVENPPTFEYWGDAVAVHEGVAAVSALKEPTKGPSAGAVWVLHNVGGVWTPEVMLTAPDGKGSDNFGTSLAVGKDVIFVGADGADHACEDPPVGDWRECNSGAVYVFTWNGSAWQHTQTLRPSDSSYGQRFGRSMALSDNMLVVGAPTDSAAEPSGGAVYVFENTGSGWVQAAAWRAGDAEERDQVGFTVACDNSVIAAGAIGGGPGDQGAVYVMDYASGSMSNVTRLLPGDADFIDLVGISVAVGDGIVFMASRAMALPYDSPFPGKLYASVRGGGGWPTPTGITVTGLSATPRLGECMAYSGGELLAGAPGESLLMPVTVSGVPPTFSQQSSVPGGGVVCDVARSADWNNDGFLTTADYNAYLTDFSNNVPAADFDGNGLLDVHDLTLYDATYQAGC